MSRATTSPTRHRRVLLAALFWCHIASLGHAETSDWHTVHATREGLVGRVTASGHRIRERDWFVALPSRTALHRRVRVCYKGQCIEAVVKDVGPWNTRNNYWDTGERPQAESGQDRRGRRTNGAGIDLSDGIAEALALGDGGRVQWRFLP